MKTISVILVMFLLSDVIAQEDSLFVCRENQLVLLLNNLRTATKNSEKESNNKVFKEYLLETIKIKNAINYPFAKLTSIGTVFSDDKKIRLFNWNVEQDDQSQKYYCYILRYDEKKKDYLLSELIDNSFMISARPDGVLEGKDWYGALYYKIIPVSKGNKQMYTLLGFDANTSMSNIKLIDVLSFTANNPKLGAPIFKTKTETLKRVFFEHSEKAFMSLKYEANYNRIIYDHLSPETPSMTGFYSYYVPDFSYDAFMLVKDKWVLTEDVVGVNGKTSEKLNVYVQNDKGELEQKEIKDKWINPSDPTAAAGSSNHVAITPDSPLMPEEKRSLKDKLFKKKEKKYKPETYSTYPYSEVNRKRKRNRTAEK